MLTIWPSFWCRGMRNGWLEILLTRILVVIWLTICAYNVKLAWVVGWNKKLRSFGRKTSTRGIIILEQGGTILLLLARSYLLKNCLRYLRLIGIVTSQLFIKARFLLMLITKPSRDKILFSTSIFAQKPLTKCSSHFIEAYIRCPVLSSPGK